VAPATAPNQSVRNVYLPEGLWHDFWSNQTYIGSQLIAWTNTDQSKVAVFVRAGAIIPMIATNIQTLHHANYIGHTNLITPDDALEFVVYPTTNSSFDMYDGTEALCASNNTVVSFGLTSMARPVSLRIRASPPAGVQRDGVRLPGYTNALDYANAIFGWRYDASGFVLVKVEHAGGATEIRLGPDTVGDGIPNAWRDLYFGDATATNGLSCISCDPDQDGHSNGEEYLAGTDPNDPASVMRILDETVQSAGGSNHIVISWPSQAGIPYRLDWKNEAKDDTSWYSITSRFTGTGGTLMWTDTGNETTNTFTNQRYYRIGVQ
jgi:hypothetical protein